MKSTYSIQEKQKILASNPRPNFLILFADDLGYGDLGFNGHPTISTPNLDHYAHEGKRLTQWYSGFHGIYYALFQKKYLPRSKQCTVCSPSRAAMLTGRLCVRSGCCGGYMGGVFRQDAIGGLPTNESTFGTILQKAGYATMTIGITSLLLH